MESDKMITDPYADLHESATRAAGLLRRMSDGVLEQMAGGDWDESLSPDAARDLSSVIDAMFEQVRHTRELAGSQRDGHNPIEGGLGFRSLLETRLPLNRKERFYTGTVLPMLIASDDFRHFNRFTDLCGLEVETTTTHGLGGNQEIQFFTEYSFLESCFTERDRDRFPKAPTEGNTPDVLIAGDDWLLAVEAKVYHNPTAEALNTQMQRQRVIVDYLREQFAIPPERVAHVLLLPSDFHPGKLHSPVVTWEAVLDEYRVVGPAYWVGVLEAALSRYEDLVSRGPTFGSNADGKMLGSDILAGHADGSLAFTYMGRQDGINGKPMQQDIETGQWRTHQYEVRYLPLQAKNWFSIKEFIARTSEDPIFQSRTESSEPTG
jgi:hypothetical protein